MLPDLRHGEWSFSDDKPIEVSCISDQNELYSDQFFELNELLENISEIMPSRKRRYFTISPAMQKQIVK